MELPRELGPACVVDISRPERSALPDQAGRIPGSWRPPDRDAEEKVGNKLRRRVRRWRRKLHSGRRLRVDGNTGGCPKAEVVRRNEVVFWNLPHSALQRYFGDRGPC